jgi:hypothetical protein
VHRGPFFYSLLTKPPVSGKSCFISLIIKRVPDFCTGTLFVSG